MDSKNLIQQKKQKCTKGLDGILSHIVESPKEAKVWSRGRYYITTILLQCFVLMREKSAVEKDRPKCVCFDHKNTSSICSALCDSMTFNDS